MRQEKSELKLGLLSAVAAHLLWGFFPLFWSQVGHVDLVVVVCHRVMWASFFLVLASPYLIKADRNQGGHFTDAVRRPAIWLTYGMAALLVAINWLTFIWAVNHQRVLEASLGYYINPLLNVCLGVLILGEHLSKPQWLAVCVAGFGVGVMTVAGGGLPWVSIVLATTFALYALVKKRSPLPALLGLLLETGVLAIPALIYLILSTDSMPGVLGTHDTGTLAYLVLGGFLTVLPLALFTFAAHRVPLSAMGLLQYIGPTLQFLVGVVILAEPFDGWRFVGFLFVWLALAIYFYSSRYQPQPISASAGQNGVPGTAKQ